MAGPRKAPGVDEQAAGERPTSTRCRFCGFEEGASEATQRARERPLPSRRGMRLVRASVRGAVAQLTYRYARYALARCLRSRYSPPPEPARPWPRPRPSRPRPASKMHLPRLSASCRSRRRSQYQGTSRPREVDETLEGCVVQLANVRQRAADVDSTPRRNRTGRSLPNHVRLQPEESERDAQSLRSSRRAARGQTIRGPRPS